MQFISKDVCRRTQRLFVSLKNRRSGKAEEQRIRKRCLDRGKHFSKGGSMAFVDDKDDPLGLHRLQVPCAQLSLRIVPDVAHFLDG